MKSEAHVNWGLALLLMALPLAVGCSMESATASAPDGASTNSELAVAAADAPHTNPPAADAMAQDPTLEPAEDDISMAPVKAVSTAKVWPPTVRSNGPVAEVIKLAEAGVEESVLIAYVTNTRSMFNLSADEIVFLNDIGVANEVVTTIFAHDQALKAAATLPATDMSATAPSPADIAPQAQEPPPPQEQTQADVQPPPETAPTQTTFYESLAPYGTWVDVGGYGLCWQPSVVVVNPGWRPYCHGGRWLYSDYGWYWASDYSWGWAPFHYGRWFNHHSLGWCWYPGYAWGPSWVTWRYTPAYCGWAPLPPCAVWQSGVGLTYWGSGVSVGFSFGIGINAYSFVPWQGFHHRYPYKYCLPYDHHDHYKAYHNSTPSTKLVVTRHGVSNRGLDPDHVTRVSGAPVQRVTVRDAGTMHARSVRGDRLGPDGSTVIAYRPRLRDPSTGSGTGVRPAPVNRSSRTPEVASPETAPPGALKPVTASRGRPSTTEPVQVRRPLPAKSLTGEQYASLPRGSQLGGQRTRPGSTAPSRAPGETVAPRNPVTSLPPAQTQPSAVRPGNNVVARQADKPASTAGTGARLAPSRPDPTRNLSSGSRNPVSPPQNQPGNDLRAYTPTRQNPPPSTQYAPVPQRPTPSTPPNSRITAPSATPRYSPPSQVQRQSPQPAYAPAPSAPRAPNAAQAAPRVAEVPRYTAPAPRPNPTPAQPTYRAPAPAPSQPAYRAPAPTPSYQAPSTPRVTPAPSAPPASPSRPDNSGAQSSRGGRNSSSRSERPGR